jgi:two-component system response regulator HydG
MAAEARLLIVDDHRDLVRVLGEQLQAAGHAVEVAQDGGAAIDLIKRVPIDVVVTDLKMGHVNGMDVLDAARRHAPAAAVIVMTAFGAIDGAIEAIKRGAFHYLAKPFALDELLVFIDRALASRRLRDENRALRRSVASAGGAMIGQGPRMRALFDLVERLGQSGAPVLVRGESGTGKELVARALHFGGLRSERAFVPVNCTALPGELLESELFGHVRGAFTGATTVRRGLLVEADGGTLFLDEIGDMPLNLQAKILRVLEDGEVRAVGADAGRRVDVRFVCATHQDLEARVREGKFRRDLFFRLDVVPVEVPPLRARAEDIPRLAAHFLERARARNAFSRVTGFTPEATAFLARQPWPGNVRELENLIERAVIVCATSDRVDEAALAALVPAPLGDVPPLADARRALPSLKEVEADYIGWVLERCGGNKTRAAQILGIDASTLYRHRQKTAKP